MKLLFIFVGSMAVWALVGATTPSEYVPPIATLLGLTGLVFKYLRDHRTENDQHNHYERIIEHQREYYESTIEDLRHQLKLCQENRRDK